MIRRFAVAAIWLAAAGCSEGDDDDHGPGADAGADADRSDAAGPADAGGDPPADGGEHPDGSADAGAPEPETIFDDMLLAADGPRLVGPDGADVDFRGAISCCGGGYGWPLVDDAWIDLTSGYGVTFLHVRLGPFLTGPAGESDWADVGGAYPEVDGRADLDAWNEPFWDRVRALLASAGEHGMWVEVDVADGWAIKHCRWGDLPGYSAWDPTFNVQGEDLCATAGSGPIEPGSRHDLWARKVFEETGRFGNVLYQDGNELGLVDGYASAWTLSLRDLLRETEAAQGYARHLLGTNTGDPATMQADGIELVELHQASAPDPASCLGRVCLSNEYNPDPPLPPDQIVTEHCAARAAGTYFWYWRHGQTAEQMLESLAGMQAGCL